MGVLGLTYFILDKFSRATVKHFRKSTRVYFDGNDLLHSACGRTEGNDVNLVTDEVVRFMKEVMSSVDSAITEIHFVIDGVCCVGKIQQQRIRRLTPSDEVRKYDTLMLTSGTPFMKELSDVLQRKFTTAFSLPATVHYELDAGEGEHVIFDLIDQAETGDDMTNMIVGRDGDISNIAMMRKSKNILIRTSQQTDGGEQEKFIDVNKYVELLEEKDIDPQMWVVCMFLAGNDFLPHMFGIHSTFTAIGLKILSRLQGRKFTFQWNALGVFQIVNLFLADMISMRHRDRNFRVESSRYDDVFVAVHRNDRSFIRSTPEVQIKRCAVEGSPCFSGAQLRAAKIDAVANYIDVFLWNVAYYLGSKRVRSCEVYFKYGIPPCASVLNEPVFKALMSLKQWRVFQEVNHKMTVEEQHAVVMPPRVVKDTHMAVEVFTNDKPDYRWTRIFMPIPCSPYSGLMYIAPK